MLFGYILTLGIGLIVAFFVSAYVYDNTGGGKDVLYSRLSFVASLVGIATIGVLLTVTCGNALLEQDIAAFEVTKQTYEAAINDERLTGLERLELTNNIIDYNRQLVSSQVTLWRWWKAGLSVELREQFELLTPIGLNNE